MALALTDPDRSLGVYGSCASIRFTKRKKGSRASETSLPMALRIAPDPFSMNPRPSSRLRVLRRARPSSPPLPIS
ncbi:MAG: hypothetical protein RXP77_00630, partial [Nitrososphaeria archaeon]